MTTAELAEIFSDAWGLPVKNIIDNTESSFLTGRWHSRSREKDPREGREAREALHKFHARENALARRHGLIWKLIFAAILTAGGVALFLF